jgi:hypothetical protein
MCDRIDYSARLAQGTILRDPVGRSAVIGTGFLVSPATPDLALRSVTRDFSITWLRYVYISDQ